MSGSPGQFHVPELRIPPYLRDFKSTGKYDSAELASGLRLVWSEPVGDRLVLVWHASDQDAPTCIGTLEPGEMLGAIRVIPPDAITPELSQRVPFPIDAHEDSQVVANRFGIQVAERLAAQLRQEARSPATYPAWLVDRIRELAQANGETWLRRQLEGLVGSG